MNDRLYRSRQERMIAGVGGGMAERFDVDPSLVRVAWLIFAIVSGGIGVLVYIAMAIIVPERPGAWPAAAWSTATGPAGPGQPIGGGVVPPVPPPPGPGSAFPADATTAGEGSGAPPAPPEPPPAAAWVGPDGPVPAAPWTPEPGRRRDRDARNGALIFGLILVLVGGWFLLRQLVPSLDLGLVWPVILVAIGIGLMVLSLRRGRDA